MLFDLSKIVDPREIDLDPLQTAAQANDPTALFWGSLILENGFNTGKGEYAINMAQAVEFARAGAEIGDPLCTVRLGILAHFHAAGTNLVERHFADRLVKSRMATVEALATEGNLYAKDYVGFAYFHGIGVPRHLKKSITYWEQNAALGDPFAQEWLSRALETGQAIKRDLARATAFLERAAELGLAEAQRKLGDAYALGQLGLKIDRNKSMEYFHAAANQGYPAAMLAMGAIYYYLPNPDIDQAMHWFKLSEQHGNPYGAIWQADLMQKGLVPGDQATTYNLYADILSQWVAGYYEGEASVTGQNKILDQMKVVLRGAQMSYNEDGQKTSIKFRDGSQVEVNARLSRTAKPIPMPLPKPPQAELETFANKFGL